MLARRFFSNVNNSSKMAFTELKKRKRSDYGYHLDYRLRWSDNDMYHHMNNNIYGFLFDSIVNQYLAEHCGRTPATSTEVGIIVNSRCDFFGSIAYPGVAECGMRVNKLGRTSATYEIGVFEQGKEEAKAVGGFTHVFCDKETFKPQKAGMCQEVRDGLSKLLAKEESKL